MSRPAATIGPAIYRSLDGKSDLACIITQVDADGKSCCITIFGPGRQPEFFTRIEFDRNASPTSVKPGTVYRW